MNTPLALFSILAALAFLIGVVATAIGMLRAPEGYEDESGFHHVGAPEVPMASKDSKDGTHSGPVGLAA